MKIDVSFALDSSDLPAFEAFLEGVEKKTTTTAPERIVGKAPELAASYDANELAEHAAVASAVSALKPADTKVVFGEEDVTSATLALANKKGVPSATAVLKQFNVDRARDLKPEQREAYITAAKAAEAA